MLTHTFTPFKLANLTGKKIITSIYFDETKKCEVQKNKPLTCPYCNRVFSRRDVYKTHYNSCRTRMENELKMYKENPGCFREFKTTNPNEKLELSFPLPNEERLVMYISGKNGCGKSTFIANLLKNYVKVFDERDIFLFSSQDFDDKLDDLELNNYHRISMDSLVDEPISLDDIRNSICIFDDVDSIRDKKVSKAVDDLKFDILKNGRSHNGDRDDDIDVIITNHIPNAGHSTKTMIHEAFYYVVFPNGSTAKALMTICDYAGLDKEHKRKILTSDSRAVIIHNNYPSYVLTSSEIFLVR